MLLKVNRYTAYFMNRQIVSLSYVAFAVLVITIIAFVDLMLTLYPSLGERINMS